MKTLKLLILVLFLCGCSKGEPFINIHVGNYKIVSYKSAIPVDLNDDNVSSYELLSEINSFSHQDLEIRPTKSNTNQAKIISINLPKTELTFQYPSNPDGWVEFISYGFGTSYEFENNEFKLSENAYTEYSYIDNIESNRNVVLSDKISVVDATHLKTAIEKEYYDFNIGDWRLLNIDIIFEKVE